MKHCWFLLGLVLCSLAGCGGRPVVLDSSEEGVVVRYDPNAVTATEATAAAQSACAKYGRNAVPGGTAMTGDVFASFTCTK